MLIDYAGEHAGSLEEAAQLAHRLGGYPLALRAAGAYLASASKVPDLIGRHAVTTFVEYQQQLDERPLGTGATSASQSDFRLVDSVLEASTDVLERRGLLIARPLLQLLAFFGDAPIPCELLLDTTVLAASPLFPQIDEATLRRTLQSLTDVALAEVTTPKQNATEYHLVLLHRLVRDTNRRSATDDTDLYLDLAVDLLHKAGAGEAAGDPAEPATWPAWHALAPHAFAVFTALAAQPEPNRRMVEQAGDTLIGAAMSLYARDLYTAVEADLKTTIGQQRQRLGDQHPETLTTRKHLADIIGERGDHAAAETEYLAVLAARRRILGEDHPDTHETTKALERTRRGRTVQQFESAGAPKERSGAQTPLDDFGHGMIG